MPEDIFRKDIIKFLGQTPIKYTTIKINERNVYLHGVSVSNYDDLTIACNIANKRRKILNIVEPNRDLTYMCLKLHFTPYIENEQIVWSYW